MCRLNKTPLKTNKQIQETTALFATGIEPTEILISELL